VEDKFEKCHKKLSLRTYHKEKINVETSDLNPRVMCTSKSKKQVTLVATTRLTLN
jgi:phosphotransferase system IIB component